MTPIVAKILANAETSPAAASTAASANALGGFDSFDAVEIVASLQGATGGTLNVYVQASWDGGTSWFDWIAFPQLAAAASTIHHRVSPGLPGVINTVGKDLTPLLSAGSVAGTWGPMLRVVYKAGASTSAGAAQTVKAYGYNARR